MFRKKQQRAAPKPKKAPEDIVGEEQFPLGTVHGSLAYQLPVAEQLVEINHEFHEVPKIEQRVCGRLRREIPLYGAGSSSIGRNEDPAVAIVQKHRAQRHIFRIGSIEIDITQPNNGLPASGGPGSAAVPAQTQLNRIILGNSGMSTPQLKRNRDSDAMEVSSSIKKNRRMMELQQDSADKDTTMELSFEGKAMDRNDYVKLVDSSGIADESHLPDCTASTGSKSTASFDTRNLLQNTEFSFEYKRGA